MHNMENPEAFLDALTIRSLKERYHGNVDQDAMGVAKDAIPACLTNNEDLELFVRDFTIDDSISDCFAESDCDTPTVIGVNCRPSSQKTPPLTASTNTSHSNDDALSRDSSHVTTPSSKRHNIMNSLFHRRQKRGDNSSTQSSSVLSKVNTETGGNLDGHVLNLERTPRLHARSNKATQNVCGCGEKCATKQQAGAIAGVHVQMKAFANPLGLESPSCLKADEFYSDRRATKTKCSKNSNVKSNMTSSCSSCNGSSTTSGQTKVSDMPVCQPVVSEDVIDLNVQVDDNSKKEKRSKGKKSKFGLNWVIGAKRSKKNNKKSGKSHSQRSDHSQSSVVESSPSSDPQSNSCNTSTPMAYSHIITDATFDELFLEHARCKLRSKAQSRSEPRLDTHGSTGTTFLTEAEISFRRKSDGYAYKQLGETDTADTVECMQTSRSGSGKRDSHPSEKRRDSPVNAVGTFLNKDFIKVRKSSPWYETDADGSLTGVTSRDPKHRCPLEGRAAICDVINHSADIESVSKSSCSIRRLKAKKHLSKSDDSFVKSTTERVPQRGQRAVSERNPLCDMFYCRHCQECVKQRTKNNISTLPREKSRQSRSVCNAHSKETAGQGTRASLNGFVKIDKSTSEPLFSQEVDFYPSEPCPPGIVAGNSKDISSSTNNNNNNVICHTKACNNNQRCHHLCNNTTTTPVVSDDITTTSSSNDNNNIKNFENKLSNSRCTTTPNIITTTEATTVTTTNCCNNSNGKHFPNSPKRCMTTHRTTNKDLSEDSKVSLPESTSCKVHASPLFPLSCPLPKGDDNNKTYNKSDGELEGRHRHKAEQTFVLEMVNRELLKRLILIERRFQRLAKKLTQILTALDKEDALSTLCKATEQLGMIANANGKTTDSAKPLAKNFRDLQDVVSVLVDLKSSLEDAQNLTGSLSSTMTETEMKVEDLRDLDVQTIARSLFQETEALFKDNPAAELSHQIQQFVTNHLHPYMNDISARTLAHPSPRGVSGHFSSKGNSNKEQYSPAQKRTTLSLDNAVYHSVPSCTTHSRVFPCSGVQDMDNNRDKLTCDNLHPQNDRHQGTGQSAKCIRETGISASETGFPASIWEHPSQRTKRRTEYQAYGPRPPVGLQRQHYLVDWSYESGSDDEFEDDDSDDDDDDDDDRDLVRLNVENEGMPHEDLRHHRLRRHLQSVQKLRHNHDDLIETVVTGTGETLTPFDQPRDVSRVDVGVVSPSRCEPKDTVERNRRPKHDTGQSKTNDGSAKSPQKSGHSRPRKMFRFRFFGRDKHSVKETELSDDEVRGQ